MVTTYKEIEQLFVKKDKIIFYFKGNKNKEYGVVAQKIDNKPSWRFFIEEWKGNNWKVYDSWITKKMTKQEFKENLLFPTLKKFGFKDKQEKKIEKEKLDLGIKKDNKNKPKLNISMIKKDLPFEISEPTFITRGFEIRELIDSWKEGLKELERKFDFDVYLPTKKKNLQRPLVWTLLQKQSFILNLIMTGKFSPYIAVIRKKDQENYSSNYEVIDWKQRLTTLISFYKNEFPIEINGYEYYRKDLDESFEEIAWNRQMSLTKKYLDSIYITGYTAQEIYFKDNEKKVISDEDKIEWFKQLNFLWTPQDKKHLENLIK